MSSNLPQRQDSAYIQPRINAPAVIRDPLQASLAEATLRRLVESYSNTGTGFDTVGDSLRRSLSLIRGRLLLPSRYEKGLKDFIRIQEETSRCSPAKGDLTMPPIIASSAYFLYRLQILFHDKPKLKTDFCPRTRYFAFHFLYAYTNIYEVFSNVTSKRS